MFDLLVVINTFFSISDRVSLHTRLFLGSSGSRQAACQGRDAAAETDDSGRESRKSEMFKMES